MAYIKTIALITILLHCISPRAQIVRIGSIDIYGNRNIPSDTILQYAKIAEGDSITRQYLLNRNIEKNIQAIKGIKLVKTTLVCCDKNGNYHLFIGIAESDSNILSHRDRPKLRIKLPE